MSTVCRCLALTVLAAGLAVPGFADFPEIKQRGTLRVLASADENPAMFDFKASANPGFEREIAEGFAKLHRLELEVVRIDNFETMLPTLVEGKGDFAIGLIDTAARRQAVDFTLEILPARHLVVNRKPAPPVATAEALRAEKVGVITGTSWEDEAKKAGVPAGRMAGYADTGAVLEALRAGKVSAIVMSLSDFTLAARKDPALQAGAFLGAPTSAAWAVRKSDPQLRKALDAYLDSLRRTPSWSRLVVKYFGQDALAVLGRARQ